MEQKLADFKVIGISNKITNKVSNEIYSIYTDYESDYTGKYTKLVAKGELPGAVVDIWEKVWKEDKELKRRYTADFEVYGEKAQKGADSEVEVFIARE